MLFYVAFHFSVRLCPKKIVLAGLNGKVQGTRVQLFPATTPVLSPTEARKLSGSDPLEGPFWPEPVLRTNAFYLRIDWSDRTNGKRSYVLLSFQPPGVSLTERDPRWLGAWWLGDLTGGVALLLVGLILLGYPRELPGARAIREEAIQNGVLPSADKRFKGRLRDIVPATKTLLANSTYMFQNMALTVG